MKCRNLVVLKKYNNSAPLHPQINFSPVINELCTNYLSDPSGLSILGGLFKSTLCRPPPGAGLLLDLQSH